MTHDVTLLGQSYGDGTKFTYQLSYPTIYERSDEEEVFDHEMTQDNNHIINHYNVVSNHLYIKEKEKCLDQQIDEELEVTLNATSNPKVKKATKNLQASCNENTDKIMKQAL